MLNIRFTGAALMAAALLAACGGTPTRESTGEYIDDTTITTKVKAALVADKSVKATNVSVETFKGTVQLSGFADNAAEITRAVEVASKVTGVKAVQNEIKLKSSEKSQ